MESGVMASVTAPAERPLSARCGVPGRIAGGQILTPLPPKTVPMALAEGWRLDLEIAFGRPLSDRSALRRGPWAI